MRCSRSIRVGAFAVAWNCATLLCAQSTPEEFFHRGFDKELSRDLDGALADFNRALALDPDYAEALTGRGFVRHAKGDVNGALADYNHAIQSDPDYFMAYNNRGNIKRAKGDLAGALDDFDRAIRLKPDYPNALVNRGGLRAAQGDFGRAITDYNRAITLKPDHAVAYNNRGTAEAATGALAAARADFDHSLQFDPSVAAVYANRANTLVAQGDFARAVDDYSTAIKLAKDDAAYAWCYRYLTMRRLHRETGEAELTTVMAKWKDAWAKVVGGYLTGAISNAGLFAEAESRGRMDDADYFAGMMHLLKDDDPAAARNFFTSCVTLAKPSDTFGSLARAELNRLPHEP